MKKMYVDIGELGWSMYISAHVRWLKNHNNDYIGVMTHVDRHCLYNGIADAVYALPDDYYTKFKRGKEVYFGFKGIKPGMLNSYFVERIPREYKLEGCFLLNFPLIELIYKPYLPSKKLNGRKEILIFPRCRNTKKTSRRNLPEHFYAKMIGVLCDKFPDHIIRAIGIPSGSYSINGIKRVNYINDVREGADLQELIDRCQVAVVAVGSQSAPPKITLLQGVPTFMIGHQRIRHMNNENWMKTKVEFYDVIKWKYNNINVTDCINKIIAFVEGC